MSHTSTDGTNDGPADGAAADTPGSSYFDNRSFRRALVITIAVLAVLVAAFAGLNYLQGPKLSSARIDASRVVTQSGQQLRLFANQNVAVVKQGQVSVTPAAKFTVSTSGEVIAVQFTDKLHYGTRYSVRVNGVENAYQPQRQTFRFAFTTAAASVYYLDRANTAAGEQTDSIVRTGLRGSDRTVVYSAPHIQQFVVFPRAIAVTTLNDDHTSSLSLVSLDKGLTEQLLLPGQGIVERLQAAPDAGIIGFIFTSNGPVPERKYSSTLMTVDLTGAHTIAPLLDLASKPLGVLNWLFLSGSRSIVAQTFDQTVLLIDAKKPASSVPLGQYADLGRSSPDGKTLVVGDVFGKIAYSLSSGKQTRLPALPIDGEMSYGGDLMLVGPGTARVQQIAVFDPARGGRYQGYLVYENGTETRILYQSKDDAGSIEGFSVSPNGQYVAVNVVPNFATSFSDGYFADSASTSITTLFIDIAAGNLVRSVEGFDESW